MSVTEQRVQTICLVILTVIVCGAVLHYLQLLFLPFLLAVLISLGLSALVTWQVKRLSFPVTLAVLTTLLLTSIVFALIGALIVASVDQMIASSSSYETQLHQLFGKVIDLLPLNLVGLRQVRLDDAFQNLPIQPLIVNVGSSILEIASLSVLVLLYVVYLLFVLAQHRYEVGLWREIVLRVRSYLLAKTAISLAAGVLVGVVLSLCGIQFSAVFGMLSGLLNFIPFAGPLVASLVPWPVILLSPDLSTAELFIGLFFPGTLFFVVGNFLEPELLGKSVRLHPLVVLLALMFWGVLWGPLGVLLAAPITGILVQLLSYLPATRSVALRLADDEGSQSEPSSDRAAI